MSRPLWFVELIKKSFSTRFKIADMARRVPWFGKIVDHFLFRGDDVIYLPRDNVVKVNHPVVKINPSVVQINQPIATPEETVLPSEVVTRFIHEAKHIWIMDKCLCRDSDQCEDYPIDLGCVFMGEAVLQINPKLGWLASKDEALAHLQRARDAGLVHMIGRNRIDNVWMGVAPHGKLLTICNCCPCCCLWKVLPNLPVDISCNVTKMPGVNVTVTDRCVGCGVCTRDVCFVDAIQVVDGRAVISDACRGCGRCVEVCPQQAIELTVDSADFVEQSVARIAPLVDIS